jgi:hypothetical protein
MVCDPECGRPGEGEEVDAAAESVNHVESNLRSASTKDMTTAVIADLGHAQPHERGDRSVVGSHGFGPLIDGLLTVELFGLGARREPATADVPAQRSCFGGYGSDSADHGELTRAFRCPQAASRDTRAIAIRAHR